MKAVNRMNRTILLIAFYNRKALGVKVLAGALKRAGYVPHILFFKDYNSKTPGEASQRELRLLTSLIGELKPRVIGLSVMSSLYLDCVIKVHSRIKSIYSFPVIWGGVYPTLFPERCLVHADFVLCGEGEEAFAALLEALEAGKDVSCVPNLAYLTKDGTPVVNPVLPLIQDLDRLGFPEIGGEGHSFISGGRLIRGDPQLTSLTYETTASRGCPFACSYCSSVNLKRIYRGKGPFVRFRSVESVIGELKQAKSKMRHLKLIHFWDEIFSDEEAWIEAFADRYQKEIHLPFTIWSHPLKIRERSIGSLVRAGLYHAVVGIQSGSDRIRSEIFHRAETREQILEAGRILHSCRVPQISYDFMLRHPFETSSDLRDTFELCMLLPPPFDLNLHGLNFLPGTDIADMAVSRGLVSRTEMEKRMGGSMREQYQAYWGVDNRANSLWMSMIYLTQFEPLRPLLRSLADRSECAEGTGRTAISALRKLSSGVLYIDRNLKKAKLLLRGSHA
jgi:radical SAM superfamily enzyme YgiQ (UPF0313 family)